jgi:hypothetical protein
MITLGKSSTPTELSWLCLHEWGTRGHPSLMSPHHGMPGNGLLLFFRVDDFDLALQRARPLVTGLEEERQT